MNAQVICHPRAGVTLTFKLKDQDAFLGRDPTNAVSVPVEGVSRQHAKIRWDGKTYWLEDLTSTNGTFLNGQAAVKERLKHLDVIGLGRKIDLVFLLRAPEAATARQGIVDASLTAVGDGLPAIPIAAGEMTLGRAPSNNVVADSSAVSKVHARIERTIDQLVLEDLGSANGTFVNGARVMNAFLVNGDELSLGGVDTYRVSVTMGEVKGPGTSVRMRSPFAPAPERQQFAAEWKTRFEWDSGEREALEDLRKQIREREREKEQQGAKQAAAGKPGGKAAAKPAAGAAKAAAPAAAKAAAPAAAKAATADAAKPTAAPAADAAKAAAPAAKPAAPAAPPTPKPTAEAAKAAAPAAARPAAPAAAPAAPAKPPVVAKPPAPPAPAPPAPKPPAAAAPPPRPAAPPLPPKPAAPPFAGKPPSAPPQETLPLPPSATQDATYAAPPRAAAPPAAPKAAAPPVVSKPPSPPTPEPTLPLPPARVAPPPEPTLPLPPARVAPPAKPAVAEEATAGTVAMVAPAVPKSTATKSTKILEVRLVGSSFDLAVREPGAHELGRAIEAPLRVNHPTISRKHARVILSDDRGIAYLQDAGGANGTRLNGKAIEKLAPLSDGDKVGIGEVELTVTLKRG